MLLLVFSVYDSKAEAYLRPFFAETKGLAVRGFRDAVNDPSSPMFKYPEDFTLFWIGVFSVASGKLEPRNPDSLGVALTFKEVVS